MHSPPDTSELIIFVYSGTCYYDILFGWKKQQNCTVPISKTFQLFFLGTEKNFEDELIKDGIIHRNSRLFCPAINAFCYRSKLCHSEQDLLLYQRCFCQH